jgi:hypothetical protein
MRAATVTVGVVVVLAALIVGLLWLFQRQLIYLPSGEPVSPASSVVPGARDVTLGTADGLSLGAWYVPAGAPDGHTVLVANGNAGHRGDRAPLARALHDRGLGVLLFDYRGYGGNAGAPSERGLALDVRAARQWLLDHADVPADRIIYFGESLGGAVVVELAVEHPPAGLVLRSPFVDLASVGRVHYPFLPVRRLLRDRFTVAAHVASVRAPTTVVYGSGDSIVPPQQSRAVADAALKLRQVVEVPGADHNDPVLFDGPQVVEAVIDLTR